MPTSYAQKGKSADDIVDDDVVTIGSQSHGKRTGSSIGAYFNVVCVIAGTGTLQLPYTIQQSGWIGLGLVVLSALMAVYTGNLLIRCLYVYPDRRLPGYPDIGQAAFGRWGRWVVQFFNYSIMLGAGCLYIILTGTSIHNMLVDYTGKPFFSPRIWIAIAGAIIALPVIAIKTLKEAAVMSAFGTLTTVIVVVVAAVLSGVDASRADRPAVEHSVVNPSQLAVALASISFAFGGNVVYPHVESAMRYPRAWPRVLSTAIITTCVMYLIICVPCYMAYGSLTKSPIFENLPKGPATLTAMALITVHVILAAPLLITSFSLEMETSWRINAERLGRAKEIGVRTALRAVTVLLLTVVAMVVPYFSSFMALLGALANCMVIFVLPIVCYLRLFGWRSVSVPTLLWCALIIVIGALSCVLGAWKAVEQLAKDFSSAPLQ